MYVSNLSPLIDAHFQIDDPEESSAIHELIESWENHSPSPRRMFKCGKAVLVLKPYALKALKTIYDEHEESKRQRARKAIQFPPPRPPSQKA
ncbi:Histidine--tRNA ligase [Bienertia sinuspersici]